MVILICLGTWDGWIHLGLEDVLDTLLFHIIGFESGKSLKCCNFQVEQQNLSVSRESFPEPATIAAVAFVHCAQWQLAALT